MNRLLVLAVPLLAASVGACVDTRPSVTNHYPVMTTLTVVPTNIDILDSVSVTCNATDIDGDSLVYDWEADPRLRIRGNDPGDPTKSNTPNNSEVFYPNYQPTALDTVSVVCAVRDLRGGAAMKTIAFTVHP